MCLKAWSIGSGTIRRYGHVRVGLAFLGESMSLRGAGFEVSKYAYDASSVAHRLLLLLTDQDIKLSVPSPALCLPASCHGFHYDDNGLNL